MENVELLCGLSTSNPSWCKLHIMYDFSLNRFCHEVNNLYVPHNKNVSDKIVHNLQSASDDVSFEFFKTTDCLALSCQEIE